MADFPPCRAIAIVVEGSQESDAKDGRVVLWVMGALGI